METHNEYCLQVPHRRKGCYCWEGDQKMFNEARIGRLQRECDRLQITLNNIAERNQKQNAEQLRIVRAVEADRDRFEAIAEQAVKTLESAMAIIEQIQGAVHND